MKVQLKAEVHELFKVIFFSEHTTDNLSEECTAEALLHVSNKNTTFSFSLTAINIHII